MSEDQILPSYSYTPYTLIHEPPSSTSFAKLRLKRAIHEKLHDPFEPLMKKDTSSPTNEQVVAKKKKINVEDKITKKNPITIAPKVVSPTIVPSPPISPAPIDATLQVLPKKGIVKEGTFLNNCRIVFMKARAYHCINNAGFHPIHDEINCDHYEIAPEMIKSAANVSYFTDETMNRLMSKVLFLYPSITNLVSATAHVFWSQEELKSYKFPLKLNSRNKGDLPLLPGHEYFFGFWDSVYNFSSKKDRATTLENAVKNVRNLLLRRGPYNSLFFRHLDDPVPVKTVFPQNDNNNTNNVKKY